MTKREVNLKIFEKKAENRVLFQPRIEWWYQYNKIRGILAPRYQKMDLLELFDDLNVSIRYFSYATGSPGAIRVRLSKKVKLEEKTKGEKKFLIYNTPRGEPQFLWPRLILGASDEVPPPADIERVRIISEMVSDSNRKLGVS